MFGTRGYLVSRVTPRAAISVQRSKIDDRICALFDEYGHGCIDWRRFVERAAALTIGAISASALADALPPDHAKAHEVSGTAERLKANYVEYASPGNTSSKMRGYRAASGLSNGINSKWYRVRDAY